MNPLRHQCFFCQGKNFHKLFKAGDYWIGRCYVCGLVYTFSSGFRRILKPKTKIYQKKEYQNYYLSDPVQQKLAKRARKRLEEIKRFISGRKLLDVGTSFGTFVKTANLCGFKAEGVEQSSQAYLYVKKGKSFKIYYGTLREVGLKNKYDAVTYWDVLEHFSNPALELKEVRKHLKKDGILVIQAPNFDSVLSRVGKARFAWLCPDDHLVHFTPETLRQVLEKSGFEILILKTWSGDEGYFSSLIKVLIPDWKGFKLGKYSLIVIGGLFDRFFPWMGWLLSNLESVFLMNGLIIAYAKKR